MEHSPQQQSNTFFVCTYRTYSKIYNNLAIKQTNKLERTEIIKSMLSDHNEIKLEVTERENKNFKYWETKQHTPK